MISHPLIGGYSEPKIVKRLFWLLVDPRQILAPCSGSPTKAFRTMNDHLNVIALGNDLGPTLGVICMLHDGTQEINNICIRTICSLKMLTLVIS